MFNGYCPLFGDNIHMGTCVEILSELGGLKKDDEILHALRYLKEDKKMNDPKRTDIETICASCPNCPSDFYGMGVDQGCFAKEKKQDRYKDIKILLIIFLVILGVLALGFFAVFLFAVTGMFALFMSPPAEPMIKYGEFPIRASFEIYGDVFEVRDTVICEYDGYESRGTAGKYRVWTERLASKNEEFVLYTWEENDTTYQITKFIGGAEYYMGDLGYWNSPDEYAASILADDIFYLTCTNIRKSSTEEISGEDLWERLGFRLIEIEYSQPIINNFVDSGGLLD